MLICALEGLKDKEKVSAPDSLELVDAFDQRVCVSSDREPAVFIVQALNPPLCTGNLEQRSQRMKNPPILCNWKTGLENYTLNNKLELLCIQPKAVFVLAKTPEWFSATGEWE